jgi:hypothetical protein
MKKIKFSPAFNFVDSLDIDMPLPGKKFIPNWYKNLSPYISKNHKNVLSRLPNLSNITLNMTSKMCVPMIDSMTSGYIITMPCDVQFVDPNLYGHRVIWNDLPWQVISTHSEKETSGFNPFNSNIFESSAYKFNGLWNIETPKGYSLLYTHPFWNYNVPFLTATGIVDSDIYSERINIPFFIKKDFFGIIEKDTPIAQIIPIKREKWISIKKNFIDNYYPANVRLKLSQSYKKRFWQKKQYF